MIAAVYRANTHARSPLRCIDRMRREQMVTKERSHEAHGIENAQRPPHNHVCELPMMSGYHGTSFLQRLMRLLVWLRRSS
jgi:hypothetical protein